MNLKVRIFEERKQEAIVITGEREQDTIFGKERKKERLLLVLVHTHGQ